MEESLVKKLNAPLPKEALSPHPAKSYLTVIHPMYVIERLNEVFGVGGWNYYTESILYEDKYAVVKGTLNIEKHDIHLQQYGGNNNKDIGDAYKGAATDALTKIASYLGIGKDIYMGKGNKKEEEDEDIDPNSIPF